MAVEARGVLPFLHRAGARSLLDLQPLLHTRISRSTCAEALGNTSAAYTIGRVLASASWAGVTIEKGWLDTGHSVGLQPDDRSGDCW